MDKVLTIVIPTYNMEALLSRCLDSLIVGDGLMQSLEVIVVNDGSKDRSSAIAHEYEARYPATIKVIDKENGNYGSCINRALGVAAGKYFKILDADDRYDTAALKEFIGFLSAVQSDIVFSPFKTLDFESHEITSLKPAEKYVGHTTNLDDVDWNESDIIRYRAMHAICVKTEVLRGNNYSQTEGISYTDTEFAFYSVLYSQSCSFFGRPIYLYYLGRDGQTMSVTSMKKSHMHFYTNAKRMLDDYILLPETTDAGKQKLLFCTVAGCVGFFAEVIYLYLGDSKKQQALLNGLIEESQKSTVSCPLEEELLKRKYYQAYKCHHVPQPMLHGLWRLFSLLGFGRKG